MNDQIRMAGVTCVLAMASFVAGCGSQSPSAPPRLLTSPAPEVDAISPTAGSTGGDTVLIITGTGFHPQATVTVGGIQSSVTAQDSTTIHVITHAHAAGQVDVVVTNPDGQADRPPGGYVYAPPQAFDFNGTWSGVTGDDGDMPFRFTIEDNVLTSVSCGGSGPFTHLLRAPVINGAFALSSGADLAIVGRIVSATVSRGTMKIAPCPPGNWMATKQ
jgi:hypothetical protein